MAAVDTFLSICLAKLDPRKGFMSDVTLIWKNEGTTWELIIAETRERQHTLF